MERLLAQAFPRLGGVLRVSAPREWSVEEFNFLRYAVFRDREVFGFEIRDVFAFFVFDYDVDVDEVGFDFDDVFVVLRFWWILRVRWCSCERRMTDRTERGSAGSMLVLCAARLCR